MPIYAPQAKQEYKYISQPKGWDDHWQAAKSAIGSTPATIAVIGDSVLAGQGPSDWRNGPIPKLRAILNAKYPQGGDYWFYPTCSSLYNNEVRGVSLWALNSGFQNYGGFSRALWTDQAQANAIVFTTPYACTDLDIVYIDMYPGTWKYQVDGGALSTVTTTGDTTPANATLKKVTVTGLSNAVHTVNIGSVAYQAWNAAIICGVSTYPTSAARTSGINVANHSFSGAGTYDYWINITTAGPNMPFDKYKLYSGQPNPQSSTGGFGFPTQPDLLILGLCGNDAINYRDLDTYTLALNNFIQSARRGKPGCSVLLVSVYGGLTDYEDVSNKVANYDLWQDRMMHVALRQSCAYYNIAAQFSANSTPFADGLVYSTSNIHPTDAGAQLIANTLSQVI